MSKKKMLGLALLVMVLWGSLFPTVKLGYQAYGIVTTGDILFFAGVRFTICGAIICLYAFFRDNQSYKPVKKVILPILMSGGFAIILHYSFTYLGLSLTESSKTAIIKQVGAIFYICFSFLFFKDDKTTFRKTVAVIMGIAGVIAINVNAEGISFNIGDVLIIAASFCTVISNIISKKVFATVHPITSTGVSQFFGGIILLFMGRCFGGSMHFVWDKSFVMIYICLASIISYCIWFIVVKSGNLSNLFIIKFAEPMCACVFGALILGEDIFKIQYLVAFLLIAGGIYISNKNKKS